LPIVDVDRAAEGDASTTMTRAAELAEARAMLRALP
jgi:hypothetical protein